MSRVARGYTISDASDELALTTADAWLVVGTYEAGPMRADVETPSLRLAWATTLPGVLCVFGGSCVVYVDAVVIAELRRHLEEDAQPMRTRASAQQITTEERA